MLLPRGDLRSCVRGASCGRRDRLPWLRFGARRWVAARRGGGIGGRHWWGSRRTSSSRTPPWPASTLAPPRPLLGEFFPIYAIALTPSFVSARHQWESGPMHDLGMSPACSAAVRFVRAVASRSRINIGCLCSTCRFRVVRASCCT